MASNLVPANIAGVAFPTSAEAISASGVKGATTFLRGDGTWAEPEISIDGEPIPFSKTRVKTKALTKNDGLHHTFYVKTVVLPGGKWLMFNRTSEIAHGVLDLDATILMRVSEDKGTIWSDPVTIYSGDGTFDPRGLTAQIMGNGRIGLIIPRSTVVGEYTNPAFVWSDDDGVTWSSKILTEASAFSGASTDIYQYPASIGGHDTLGFIAYAASGHTTTNVMVYLKTEDNGETWQSGTAMPNVPDVELSSIAVVRLGTDDRWMALVRDADTSVEAANERNGLVYKSTDMLTWTGPYDSGQMINNNPHNAVYHGGLIYWLAANRVHMGRPIMSAPGGFAHQWGDAETLWTNNGTVWPGWSDLVSVARCEGHPTFFYDEEGSIYANFGFNLWPTDGGAGHYKSMIGLMSDAQIGMDFSRLLIGMPDITSGAWTPAITFATPGDLSTTYAIQEGYWQKIGAFVYLICRLQFTPTFTTAASYLKVTGMPFPAVVSGVGSVRSMDAAWTWPAGKTDIGIAIGVGPSLDEVRVSASGSEQSAAPYIGTANMTSGEQHTLLFNGFYMAAP